MCVCAKGRASHRASSFVQVGSPDRFKKRPYTENEWQLVKQNRPSARDVNS